MATDKSGIRIYKATRHCKECRTDRTVTVSWSPLANQVFMACPDCGRTFAFPKIHL